MFRSLLEADAGETVTVYIEGQPVTAQRGETAASVLLRQFGQSRTTPVSGTARAPYCLMGVCFECLAEIDGQGSVQSCLVPVEDGMRIARQAGARKVVAR